MCDKPDLYPCTTLPDMFPPCVSILQGRLADTNANLVARTLVLAGEVAKAMGAAWDRSAREFLKAALEGLADKKKQVSLVTSPFDHFCWALSHLHATTCAETCC